MRRLPIVVFCIALLAMSCAGDTTDELSDTPPWGLASIDMPDTAEEISAVMAAFPDEIEGLTRSGGGPTGVSYEPSSPGMPWVVHAQSNERIEMENPPGLNLATAEDWLRYIGSDQMLGASEWERDLTGDLLWVANHAPMEVGPGEMGTVYLLNWAETGGTWAFYLQATSETGRRSLVNAFIAAVGG
jgi:hypothetical protein